MKCEKPGGAAFRAAIFSFVRKKPVFTGENRFFT